jgi:hypothetical protein
MIGQAGVRPDAAPADNARQMPTSDAAGELPLRRRRAWKDPKEPTRGVDVDAIAAVSLRSAPPGWRERYRPAGTAVNAVVHESAVGSNRFFHRASPAGRSQWPWRSAPAGAEPAAGPSADRPVAGSIAETRPV